MPEYVYPGVYVEELGAEAGSGHPIPGVPLDDAALESIAKELRRAVAVHAPQWTSSNESDPGIVLVELLAFLGESLRFRAGPGGGSSSASPLRRPVFFAGRLLDAAALTQEQDYQREKRRRHDLALIGSGVVSGLGVSLEPAASSGVRRVVVEPGYAIDPRGEEISVRCRVELGLPDANVDAAFVTIRFWERPCSPAPEIEEACVIGIAAEVVSPALALARIARGETGWFLDPTFAVARIGR
jgi:hypothetical protein